MTGATSLFMLAVSIGIATITTLGAGFATARWHHWRREYYQLRVYHLKVMERTRAPFIHQTEDLPAEGENVLPFTREKR